MQDVSQGEERTRKWPSSRPSVAGSKKTKQAKDFATAQIINKYMAPQILTWAHKQVENSPLLPRDVLTMMLFQRLYAFILPDGRILYPMTAKSDVSQSLDVIGAQEGDTLVRGPTGWEARSGPNGEPIGFRALLDQIITTPTPEFILRNLEPYSEFIVAHLGNTLSGAGYRAVEGSDDNGATWYNATGDYQDFNTNGGLTARNNWGTTSSNTQGAKYTLTIIRKLPGTPFAYAQENSVGVPRVLLAASAPINALRIFATGNPNFTGGRIAVYAR